MDADGRRGPQRTAEGRRGPQSLTAITLSTEAQINVYNFLYFAASQHGPQASNRKMQEKKLPFFCPN